MEISSALPLNISDIYIVPHGFLLKYFHEIALLALSAKIWMDLNYLRPPSPIMNDDISDETQIISI